MALPLATLEMFTEDEVTPFQCDCLLVGEGSSAVALFCFAPWQRGSEAAEPMSGLSRESLKERQRYAECYEANVYR